MDLPDLQRILKLLPGIIIGLTVHEYSHALVAKLCGDKTSYEQGRVTLNPLKHIDIMGFIMLFVAGFGWAKPVMFNEKYLRNPRMDKIKIALAGPFSNAVLAMSLSVVFSLYPSSIIYGSSNFSSMITEITLYAIYINWGLFVFNLIPLPPLDGSHLLFHNLEKFPKLYSVVYKYGSLLFFGLIIGTVVTKKDLLPVWPVIRFLSEGFLSLIGSN